MAHANINITRMYLKEMGQYELLNAEQELELGRLIKNGREMQALFEAGEASAEDTSIAVSAAQEAREKLINCNLRLVVKIAKEYNNEHLSLMDLVNEGNCGLIQAVDKFNPDLGYRFSTCATPWIRSAIQKSVADKGRNIRIPSHIYNALRAARKAEQELIAAGNERPSKEEIADKMGISIEKYIELQQWRLDTISLSTPLGDDSDDELEDVQPDNASASPEEKFLEREQKSGIKLLLNKLPERTAKILNLRFGLDGNEPKTLDEVGRILGITRERVRQIEKQTLAELKSNEEWRALFEMRK